MTNFKNIITDNYQLYLGDCLEVMDYLISLGIRVDCILTDPPYGTTACKWDTVIPFEDMWSRINKLIKPNGAIVLFGSEPFSSALRMSNIKNYKYDWIWQKEQGTGQLNAKKMPLRNTENISVFYKKQCAYNPQMSKGEPYKTDRCTFSKNIESTYGKQVDRVITVNDGSRYPLTIIKFNRPMKNRVHSTQKPTDLLEYLIKTYTKEGELVLDFTMGSGSTGVACMNVNRKFIGIELDEKYFNIAINRIKEASNIRNI